MSIVELTLSENTPAVPMHMPSFASTSPQSSLVIVLFPTDCTSLLRTGLKLVPLVERQDDSLSSTPQESDKPATSQNLDHTMEQNVPVSCRAMLADPQLESSEAAKEPGFPSRKTEPENESGTSEISEDGRKNGRNDVEQGGSSEVGQEGAVRNASERKSQTKLEIASARARLGQHTWRSELAHVEERWKFLEVGEHNRHFIRQLEEAKKSFKAQKVCLLLKMQIAAQQHVIVGDIDPQTSAWRGFRVLKPIDFNAFFNTSESHKCFCNLWRRFGFVPENRRWEDAFHGIVPFIRRH